MEKELEEKLREAGNNLSHFPTQIDQLLLLLDEVENLLEKVDQSPSESIQNALSQSMKALLAEPLLRHTDADVQVSVASCISEITRITAPEAPYDDDQMKDVFQLIVSSFANLSDKYSRSYDKRASILETVAKIRSSVVMLDLECDGLISEMFQHFISSIRDYHPENIFKSMETIMTLVIEESEDVSVELLMPILASLKRDNEEIPFIARKLGEGVFAKCAVKLKPYLKQAVKSLGLSLDGYSEIVTTICNGSNGEVEHDDDNVSVEQLAGESKLTTTSSGEMAKDARERITEEACLEEVPHEVQRSVKSVIGNGNTDTGDEELLNVSNSAKKSDESNFSAKSLDVNLSKADTDDLDTVNLVKVDSKQERTAKKSGKKPCSTKPSEPSCIDSDKEAENTCQKASDKEADGSPGLGNDGQISLDEDLRVDTCAPSEKEEPPLSSPKLLDGEVTVSSLSPNKSPPKKVGGSKKKDNLAQEIASVDSSIQKAIDGTSGTEVKPERSSEKKISNLAQEDALLMDSALAQEGTLLMDSAPTEAADVNSDSEIRPQKRSRKKENFVQEHESSKNPRAAIAAAADGGSDSENKPQEPPREKKGDSGQEDGPSEDPISPIPSDGSSDSDTKAQKLSGKGKVSLAQEDVEHVSLKVDDEISNFEDKPQMWSGKKAPRTKKATSCVIKGKILKGRGTSKIDTEDNCDEEEELTQSAKMGDGSDSETKPLVQSRKEITSGRRGRPLKKSGKVDVLETKVSNKKKDTTNKEGDRSDSQTDEDGSGSETKTLVQSGKEKTSRPMGQPLKKPGKGYASETKLSGKKKDTTNKEGDRSDSQTDEDGSGSETKALVQSGKEKTSRPMGQPLKKSGKGYASETKLSGKKEDKTNKDKDSSKKNHGKSSVHVKNTKEKVLSKSHAKDDDQDMIISPKSTPKPFKDNEPKENSKRKRTPGKDKVSGDIEYGANLVGAKVKIWWPDDKQYYEGIIVSFDPTKKKHKVSYTDGDEEVLVLQKEKWEFVDDMTMQEEVNEDSNPNSSAKSRSRKKAKPNPEQASKQKQMDASPRSGRGGAAARSKSKGTTTKSGGKVDSKSKDKTSKTTGRSEENWESDDKSTDDVLGAASESKEDKIKDKSKLETPKTVTKSKGKTLQIGNISNGTGKAKSSSKGKLSDSGKTPETAQGKSADTSKTGKSGRKSGKKRRRGF